MNLAVTALVGYAIKEVVSPIFEDITSKETATTNAVSPTEKQQAQEHSESTLSFIKDLIDHII